MSEGLTVIIPFKNEKEEVQKTIESLNQMAELSPVRIIVINDASDDGFDYSNLAKLPNVTYVIHDTSIGPAQSRQHGVELCTTEYFLLLDAHMRALTKNWDKLILSHLNKNRRAVFCCTTHRLLFDDSRKEKSGGIGVVLNLDDMSYKWNYKDLSPNAPITEIPCLMGASYSTNKSYWNRIRGVEGLLSYGFEEQLLTIKTVLEGGKCLGMKDVAFSHKFRTFEEVPYKLYNDDYVYNYLYIIEMFYPIDVKAKAYRVIKRRCDEDSIKSAVSMLVTRRNEIIEAKHFFANIFSCDFNSLARLNITSINS